MRRLFVATVPFALVLCACVVIALAGSCRADVINSWEGASASVSASGQNQTNSGATASASAGGSYSATSLGSVGQPLTIGISGWGSASASGNPENLLTASATLNMGETGVLRAPI